MSADDDRNPQGVANALEIAFAEGDYARAEEISHAALSIARQGKRGELDDDE